MTDAAPPPSAWRRFRRAVKGNARKYQFWTALFLLLETVISFDLLFSNGYSTALRAGGRLEPWAPLHLCMLLFYYLFIIAVHARADLWLAHSHMPLQILHSDYYRQNEKLYRRRRIIPTKTAPRYGLLPTDDSIPAQIRQVHEHANKWHLWSWRVLAIAGVPLVFIGTVGCGICLEWLTGVPAVK